jgi:hypothetical protein
MRDSGNSCDASFENTLEYWQYCGGMFRSSGAFLVLGMIRQMYSLFALIVLGLLVRCGRNHAQVACPWLIHPLFQSILGWNAVNQEYPRIALFSPRFERKKCRVVHCVPVCTCRSVKY